MSLSRPAASRPFKPSATIQPRGSHVDTSGSRRGKKEGPGSVPFPSSGWKRADRNPPPAPCPPLCSVSPQTGPLSGITTQQVGPRAAEGKKRKRNERGASLMRDVSGSIGPASSSPPSSAHNNFMETPEAEAVI